MNAQNFRIYLMLECPECSQKSKVDSHRLPHGSYNVKCNRCRNNFKVDRATSLNCAVVSPRSGKKVAVQSYYQSNVMKWTVDLPFCHGYGYDLPGLGALIRGGLVGKHTKVRPPGAKNLYQANNIHQLKQFFIQVDAETQAYKSRNLTVVEDVTLDDSKSWLNMGAGEFFNQKVKPLMHKDLLGGKQKVG